MVLTPGEAHDSTAYPDLMAERDSDPDILLGDRGYDSDPIRDDVRARGGRPEIPTKRNRLIQHSVDHAIYAMRNRIERFINRLKCVFRGKAASDSDPFRPLIPTQAGH